MTTIYFIRHGETYWNVMRKMQGRADIPLNPTGRRQAEEAAPLLADKRIDICYTSPLSRARDTALAVLRGRDQVPLVDESLLLEQNYGLSEGKSQRIGYRNPFSPLYYYVRDPERYKPAIGAESFDELFRRAGEVIDRVLLPAEDTYQGVLISAHGAIICAILGRMFGTPLRDIWKVRIGNCEIRTVQLRQGQFYQA